MKVPKTWVRLERPSNRADEGFVKFKAPCSLKRSAYLQRRCGANPQGIFTFSRLQGSFSFENGQWWHYFEKRDPDYVRPDRVAVVYGMREPACVLCRFPQGIAWRKTIVPALNKVAREYGASFFAGRSRRSKLNEAYVDGAEVETWEKTKLPRYQWDEKSFKKVD